MGVIGLGYVGLPLATLVAEAGIPVIGFDIDGTVVNGINTGASHIGDVPTHQVDPLVQAGMLHATADMSRLAECDVIAISVPTPLSKTRDPDISFILAASSIRGCEVAARPARGPRIHHLPRHHT